MKTVIVAAFVGFFALPVFAQSTPVELGPYAISEDAPVDVSADSLEISSETNSASFIGNVLVIQGDIRISAGRVSLFYDPEAGDVVRLEADGSVVFSTPSEAAEAEAALYNVAERMISLTGGVVLTQGPATLSAERLVIDLASGNARLEGRVRTVFTPGQGE
jgi:lipopolysaccharide export system protein LptA